MDINQLKETIAIVTNDTGVRLTPVYKETIDFLKEYKASSELIEFLLNFSYDRAFKINHVYFNKLNDLAEYNLIEENINCIKNGFLIIGDGLNGDPIVVNIKTNKVSFVYHDKLWEADNPSIYDMIVDMGVDISEFYVNSYNNENYPVDAYEAKKYIDKND